MWVNLVITTTDGSNKKKEQTIRYVNPNIAENSKYVDFAKALVDFTRNSYAGVRKELMEDLD